ncbi:hypothetical protein [Muriicola sp. Z0-33]|uniref:hypothetical protein n=1 Tax=Muriicola sp. Z0-33 TaxID=2816957 RepID=UPI0022375CBB|nr:hypothetical protein [Muriicola sp. Z0-33]MCW5517893.1 hypothetical protein [Muriicola sp. Z0-33]
MKKYFVIITALFILISCGSEEVVIYDVENGQTLAQLSVTSATIPTPVEGASIELEVQVTTKSGSDRAVSLVADASSTATPDQYTIDGLVIPAGEFTTTVTISSNFAALPEEGSTTLVLNLDGIAGASNAIFSNETLTVSFFRECPEAPTPGDWIVNMQDSYGDGWQSTTSNGGPGLTVTLSTGEVFEVGLCTPYEANTYACTPELSSGSATITIPDGVESAEWFFPGDFWGEMSFQIIAPSGNTVAEFGPGTAAGVFEIDYCGQ